MKSINILITATVFLLFTACNVHIKNATTKSVMINGNCAMCKSAIEIAGNIKNVALVDWNKDTKIATLTYDSIKTNQEEILKRIALAGYDSEHYLAPDDEYARLPDCCKYVRVNKSNIVQKKAKEDHSRHNQDSTSEIKKESITDTKNQTTQEINQLNQIFDNYFALKNALVKSDATLTSTTADRLHTSIKTVEMNKLSKEEHVVWMKIMDDLALEAQNISESKDIAKQRDQFMTLSESMYSLMKASKQESPVYYQHCPMANDGKGANWLSKESAIKNPYYGASMLTCGKTVETIK
ncbi:MAG: DUF3347 domain-containing protein [Saprospiraceae bacterium]|nr:DUF3347 domain-containing protein [Saprospiraceae bacterium]